MGIDFHWTMYMVFNLKKNKFNTLTHAPMSRGLCFTT